MAAKNFNPHMGSMRIRPPRLFSLIILVEVTLTYFVPYLYLLISGGYRYKDYHAQDIHAAVLVAALVLLSSFLFPVVRFPRISVPFAVVRVVVITTSLVCAAASISLDSNYRYGGGGDLVLRIIARGGFPLLLALSILLLSESIKGRRFLLEKACLSVGMIALINGTNSAITVALVILLFLNPPRLIVYASAPVLLASALILGTSVKSGGGLLIPHSLDDISQFLSWAIERQAATFAALDNIVYLVATECGFWGCADAGQLVLSAFGSRLETLTGAVSSANYFSSISQYVRSLAFGTYMGTDSGMSPGVAGGAILVAGVPGALLAVAYVWFLRCMSANVSRVISVASFVSLFSYWWIFKSLFQNPIEALSIIDPNFLMLLFFSILLNIKFSRRNVAVQNLEELPVAR